MLPYYHTSPRKGPLYVQLADNLRGAIVRGQLAPGERLPSIRAAAEAMAVSRTTVENAYGELLAGGYILSRPRSGYVVADFEGLTPPAAAREETAPPAPVYRYDFGQNGVQEAFDLKLWKRYVGRALRIDAIGGYGDPQGEPELRAALAQYSAASRGVALRADQIVVGAGVQSLLNHLLGLTGPVTAALEYPGFPQAEQVLRDHGIKPDLFSLEELDRLPPYGLMYLVPSNPHHGSSLPAEKRLALIRWAERTGAFILEDDYDGEFRYSSRPVPALQGLTGSNQVIYMGTFSRLLLPSIRISYMVLPQPLLTRYQELAPRYNQTSSTTEQMALAGFIRDGHLGRQIRKLRRAYGEKSRALAEALRREMGERVRICSYESGLQLLIEVKSPHEPETLKALAAARGVHVKLPPSGEGVFLRVGGIPMAEIPEAVHCLREAWFNRNEGENGHD